MKLIYYIILRITLALTFILTVWAIFFYVTMIDEVNDEVDDALEDYSETIIIRALAGEELPSENAHLCASCVRGRDTPVQDGEFVLENGVETGMDYNTVLLLIGKPNQVWSDTMAGVGMEASGMMYVFHYDDQLVWRLRGINFRFAEDTSTGVTSTLPAAREIALGDTMQSSTSSRTGTRRSKSGRGRRSIRMNRARARTSSSWPTATMCSISSLPAVMFSASHLQESTKPSSGWICIKPAEGRGLSDHNRRDCLPAEAVSSFAKPGAYFWMNDRQSVHWSIDGWHSCVPILTWSSEQ